MEETTITSLDSFEKTLITELGKKPSTRLIVSMDVTKVIQAKARSHGEEITVGIKHQGETRKVICTTRAEGSEYSFLCRYVSDTHRVKVQKRRAVPA